MCNYRRLQIVPKSWNVVFLLLLLLLFYSYCSWMQILNCILLVQCRNEKSWSLEDAKTWAITNKNQCFAYIATIFLFLCVTITKLQHTQSYTHSHNKNKFHQTKKITAYKTASRFYFTAIVHIWLIWTPLAAANCRNTKNAIKIEKRFRWIRYDSAVTMYWMPFDTVRAEYY